MNSFAFPFLSFLRLIVQLRAIIYPLLSWIAIIALLFSSISPATAYPITAQDPIHILPEAARLATSDNPLPADRPMFALQDSANLRPTHPSDNQTQVPKLPEDIFVYTDATGHYRFENLPLGTHKVSLDLATLPIHLRPSDQEKSPLIWIDPGMRLTSEALSTGVRFTAAYDRARGEISGLVFLDRNNNGHPDADEPGLPRVRVIDPTVHQYFVPFDDNNLWTLFEDKGGPPGCQSNGDATVGTLESSIFLTASSDGTFYYYDHWEDGYDPDPLTPGATTVVGILDAGASQLFQSSIDPNAIGTVFYFDGRDRISIFGEEASVVRQAFPSTPGSVLAGAWEVDQTADWGTTFIATVGEDLDFNLGAPDDHDYTGLEVMASQSETEVYYNGTLIAPTLKAGETLFIGGGNDGAGGFGIDSTDIITATKPIQVQMMTGACGERYSAHGYTLQPVSTWANDYWAPVPGFMHGGACTLEDQINNVIIEVDSDIYLHNPGSSLITVTVESNLGTGVVPIPANTTLSLLDYAVGTFGWIDISTGVSGIHLFSNDIFWGMSAIDSVSNGENFSNIHDWGYVLIPTDELSSQVVVGYAPGNGDIPTTQVNANMAFVTAITDTTVYIDLHQNGLPDPVDMNGDGDAVDIDVYGIAEWDEALSAFGIPLLVGQSLRVADPVDYNLQGALIYTLNYEEKIAVAWGQDPCRAEIGDPFLDLGYTVLPLPVVSLAKTDNLAVDADVTGDFTPGDVLTYTIIFANTGLGTITNAVMTDAIPAAYTTFIPGSLQVSTPPPIGSVEYSTDGVNYGPTDSTDTAHYRITWPAIGPGDTITVTFAITLDLDVPITLTQITNQAIVDGDNIDPTFSEDPEDPSDPDTDTPLGQPLLSIQKTADPSLIIPGQPFTYTIVTSNTGTGVAVNLTLTDTLPAGVTYVPGSLNISYPLVSVVTSSFNVTQTSRFGGYYLDDFDLDAINTSNYTGSDGTLTWATDWTEPNDDNSPATGEIFVGSTLGNGVNAPGYVEMADTDDDNARLQRTADLSEFVAPSLRFYVFGSTDDGIDDFRVLQDGANVQTETYAGAYTLRELSLAPGGAASVIELEANTTMDPTDFYRFDHIAIYETSPDRENVVPIVSESVILDYTTITGTDPVSYNVVTNRMVFTEGVRLPASGFITLTFQVTADLTLPGGTLLVNTAHVTADNWINITSPPTDTTSVEVLGPDLNLLKGSSAGGSVEPGAEITYTLTVSNAGSLAATNVTISDTVPANTSYVANSIAGGDSRDDTNLPQLSWVINTLSPSETVVLSFTVLVDSPLISGTQIVNTAVVTSTEVTTPTTGTVTDTVLLPDLAISKHSSPNPVAAGQTLTYTLAFSNIGPVAAQAVTITDQLPTDVIFGGEVSTPVGVTLISINPPTWITPTLEAGASGTIVFTVTVGTSVSGTITNTTSITSATPDDNPNNNHDDEPTEILFADIYLEKRVDPVTAVTIGEVITWTIDYGNQGAADAQNVYITDTLQAGMSFGGVVSETPDLIGPTINLPTVTWFTPTLASGASGTIVFTTTATLATGDGQILTNTALITTTTPETDTSNNEDTAQTPTLALAIAKTVSRTPIQVGELVSFTIVVTNIGGLTLMTIPVHDTYDPTVLSFVPDADPPQDTEIPGQITWNNVGGPLAPGQSTTLVVTFTGLISTPGSSTINTVVAAGTDGVSTTESVSDTAEVEIIFIPVEGFVDLQLDKDDGGLLATPGGLITYTLTYTNVGNQTATGVVITEVVPAHTTFSGLPIGWSCVPPDNSAGSVCTFNVGDVATDTNGSTSFIVIVDNPLSATVTTITNSAVIGDDGSQGSDPTPENNRDDELTPVDAVTANIDIEKYINVVQAAPSQTVTYTLIATNTGLLNLNPVVVTDELPVGLTYVAGSAVPSPTTISGQTLVWSDVTAGADMVPGQSVQISFRASVMTTTTGIYTNVTHVEGSYFGGTVTDEDQVPLFVADPSVALSKRSALTEVVNGMITFTIAITNTGPSTLDVVPLFDTFSGPMVYVDGVPLADMIDNVNQMLTWNDLTLHFGNLSPSQTITVTTIFSLTTTVGEFSLINTAVVSDVIDEFGNPADPADDDDILSEGPPTAVDLLYFEDSLQSYGVLLTWATAVEIDNFGFRLLRSSSGNLATSEEIAFIPGQGHGTVNGATYSYQDETTIVGETYTYWLIDVDFFGRETTHGPITITVTSLINNEQFIIYLPLIARW